MKRNKYSTKDLEVEDQRPSAWERLSDMLQPLGLGQEDDPLNSYMIQKELSRNEEIRLLQEQHMKRREGILREQEEGTRPLRRLSTGNQIYDSLDSYVMRKPDRDGQGRPLR